MIFTCMCPCVSLQVKCVIEALATEGAEIPLDITVALHVSVEESLKGETFVTSSASESARVIFTPSVT